MGTVTTYGSAASIQEKEYQGSDIPVVLEVCKTELDSQSTLKQKLTGLTVV